LKSPINQKLNRRECFGSICFRSAAPSFFDFDARKKPLGHNGFLIAVE
jgi:hypothetical protein